MTGVLTQPTKLHEQLNRLRALEKNGVEVLIIGAGINGAGLFRELCLQGLSCAIIDKGDFGSGTSAAPSRLIHGGLKYIETGELGLVAQSTFERNLLLRNAPHCVRPIETVIPIFSWAKGIWPALKTLAGFKATARSRGALLIKIGLFLYDVYGARARVMPRHAMWTKGRALRELPALTSQIVAAGTYYDAAISRPERLVWELVHDATAAEPRSAALNYVSSLACKDNVVSFIGMEQQAFALRPKIVVNAAGPWIDVVNADLGAPSHLIGGTKGSHILLDHPALLAQLNGRMIYFESNDGRILLIYPYEGRVMVGSTDQKASQPDTVSCEDWEIEYFLSALRALLPGMDFVPSQIVYAYSGIRPLPASNAKSEGLISRDHSAPIWEADAHRSFPIISLVGGKWTTFRGFAEEVADQILNRLRVQRQVTTVSAAIGGAKHIDELSRRPAQQNAARLGISEWEWEGLVARYGSTLLKMLDDLGASGLGPRLQDAPGYFCGEFRFMARQEQVQKLADVVMRRTVLALSGRLSRRDLTSIAAVVAEELGWGTAQFKRELDDCVSELSHRNRIRFAEPSSNGVAA